MSHESSPAWLFDLSAKTPIAAELWDGITQKQLDDLDIYWESAKAQGKLNLIKAGLPRSQWPQSLHWDWNNKAAAACGKLAIRGFSVVAAGVTQGLMYAQTVGQTMETSAKGKPLVYIDYVETAPWNRPNFVYAEPKYVGVGSLLIAAAIALSLEEDFKGRIGLHSLPQSHSFYVKCGMIDFGADARKQNLHYFEMTAAQAASFLKKA